MRALVYNGPGASRICVSAIASSLIRACPGLSVQIVSWRALWRRGLFEDAKLLVMPGGRDVPYLRLLMRLSPRIRAFVERGGRYLGSCAGAYFAAKRIDFARGEALAVSGPRPLGFFAGTARGPIGPRPFRYNDGAQARAIAMTSAANEAFNAYTHGGCALVPDPCARMSIVARYAHTNEASAIRCELGRGRVLLWGVHPEFEAQHMHALGASQEQMRLLALTSGTRRRIWARQVRWLLAP